MSYQGFILSNAQIIRENHTQLIFQGRLSDGRRFHWTVTRPGIVFFINRNEKWSPPAAARRMVDLRSLRGEPVDALYFRSTSELTRARRDCDSRNVILYEADVNIVSRYLMERFVKGAVSFEAEPIEARENTLYFIDPVVKPSDFTPALKLLSIDIECSLETDLYSIALYGEDLQSVLMIDPAPAVRTEGYRSFRSEPELLSAFFDMIHEYDPDAFIGWNLVGFDLNWLSRKCATLGLKFDIGTDGAADLLAPGSLFNQWTARIPGRAALDGINMVRSAFVQTEDYSLSTVAHTVLGRKKLIEETGIEKAAEITRLFHSDKSGLARYNFEDARLVYEIFEKLNLEKLAVRRSQLTGLALDRVGGSVAAFDFLYLPRLHRYGYLADTQPRPPEGSESAPGGLVFDSIPGFYRNVAVFDFKSLYPSIIRTFRVDPLAANAVLNRLNAHHGNEGSAAGGRIVKGPAGLEFAEDFAILPSIIEELWQEREKAKRLKDAALSQAVKIIMNSFYGVLGTPGCRFYDPRLAGTVTRIGHWILTFSREFIEKEGYRVIYGDTDSLFIHLGEGDHAAVDGVGTQLSGKLNHYLEEELHRRFDVESGLDIQFEKLFVRFFMPTIRGQDRGSKKRYAGLILTEEGDSELYFAGMESSRRDWTELAKEFQTDIFTLLFNENGAPPVDTLRNLICTRRKQLYEGELDDKLVYRKGISKRLKEYTKNVPPHVRAARMLDRFDERIVRYVITTAGPEPVQKRSGAPYDYDHYSEKQMAPIADMVLRFFGLEYRSITKGSKQLRLFDD
ncbi:MAG: DNA polymerase II [Desulfobacteraceae bacterium]|nr:MAG: DNA polymerase II [Desulfobacteraceae bacterium]